MATIATRAEPSAGSQRSSLSGLSVAPLDVRRVPNRCLHPDDNYVPKISLISCGGDTSS
jgi:hypothetical protein